MIDAIKLLHVAHILTVFTYLFMFILFQNLDWIVYLFILVEAYPEDFNKVEVKEESMEYEAVRYDLFLHINMITWSVTKKN